jgi:nitric oxide reductase subunit B
MRIYLHWPHEPDNTIPEHFHELTHRLWRWLGLIFVLSFGALGYLGWQIYLTAPPIPKSVATTDGELLFTGEQIQRGQQAWMAAGGQQLGTVWGHGSYVAPDWSADWLHREATALQDLRSAEQRKATPTLTPPTRLPSTPASATRCAATPTTSRAEA